MRCIADKGLDPHFNLAAEEFLLTRCTGPVFRLWRNSPSIIIGKNQNAVAEINLPNLHYINGLSLLSDARGLSGDLVHPSPDGANEIAKNLINCIEYSL